MAAAVLAAVLGLASVMVLTGSAQADKHHPVPTQAQVDAAKAAAAKKAGDVATIEAQLVVANSHLQQAAQDAEYAAEAYNGAVWRLQQAQLETARARAGVAAAKAQVEQERIGVVQLVTQNYLDGSALNGVRAFLAADGPEGIMNRWSVVHSAGDSMQARYDRYNALAALADVAQVRATKAEGVQQQLTAKSAMLRDRATAAANIAQSQAAVMAGQRRTLIQALAKAQKITVALATKRQHGLEQIARHKAAAAAEAAAKAKAKAAAAEAQNQANQAGQTDQELQALGPEGGWTDPGLPLPAGTSVGAAKAIRFARAQLGEPYVWAAAGPDSWDCSGLTMMAWRRGGVSLPHFAAAQYQLTEHLTVDQLKPGDLVFWGTSPNTIHHVALYIGNGQIIQAPHTGAYVEVSSMYGWEAPNFFGRP